MKRFLIMVLLFSCASNQGHNNDTLDHNIELSESSIAKFEGIKFSKSLYDSLADKDVQLLINIFSGRKSTSGNLLNCDILQDKKGNIKGRKFMLKGKLIYGDK